jgi:transcription initiation factor TFIID subunit 5
LRTYILFFIDAVHPPGPLVGSEDKTARLWDIHSGRTVRLLNGCSTAITTVKISPCGRFAAGADAGGAVHMWDVGTGKRMAELRSKRADKEITSMIHAMSFSACGSSLAVGGDNCCVRLWDVRRETLGAYPLGETQMPLKTFPTRQTMIMDLRFTNRNLLLAVGKFIAPVPTPVMISD